MHAGKVKVFGVVWRVQGCGERKRFLSGLIIGRDEKACILSMQLVRSVSDSKIRDVYFYRYG